SPSGQRTCRARSRVGRWSKPTPELERNTARRAIVFTLVGGGEVDDAALADNGCGDVDGDGWGSAGGRAARSAERERGALEQTVVRARDTFGQGRDGGGSGAVAGAGRAGDPARPPGSLALLQQRDGAGGARADRRRRLGVERRRGALLD